MPKQRMNAEVLDAEVPLSSFGHDHDLMEVRHILSIMLEEGGLPALSTTIKRLVDLDPNSEISVQELSEIILEDLGLTSKVLQVVNAFYYNRTGHEIATVTQAIVFLGFDTIREIALEMSILVLLSDTASDDAVALMAKVLVTAHLVKEIRNITGSNDTEEAFLAAFFSKVARVVIAVYNLDLYKKLEQLEKNGNDADAGTVCRIVGLVGEKLVDLWKLPSNISAYLEGKGPEVSPAPATNLGRLISLSYFLVDKAFNKGGSPLEMERKISEIAERFYLEADSINQCLKTALHNTRRLSPDIKRVILRLFPEKLAEEPDEITGIDKQKDSTSGGKYSPVSSDKNNELYMELLNQVGEAVSSGNFSLSQLYLMVAEALYKGLGLNRVLLCLFTRDRARLIVRYGIGRKAREFRLQFKLASPVSGSPIDRALREGREVITTWGKVSGGWTPPGENNFPDTQICVCPLLVGHRPIGCFLLDRSIGGREFSDADLKKTAALRQLLILAAMQQAKAG